MPSSESLIENAIALMSQGVRLLQLLPPSLYTRSPGAEAPKTIGHHFRQVLERYHYFCTGHQPDPSDPDTQCRIQEISTKPESTIGCLRKHIALLVTLDPSETTTEELEALIQFTRVKYGCISTLCIQYGYRPDHDFGDPDVPHRELLQQQQQCAQ